MPNDYTVGEISKMLAGQMQALTLVLLPQGKRVGNEIWVGDLNGSPGNSLKVILTGPHAGFWKDFAQGDDVRGDPVDLIQGVLRLDTGEAIRWAKNWLGLAQGMAPPPTEQPSSKGPDKTAAARIERARRIWHDSVTATDTLVENYLRWRGISVRPPLSIRFQADHEHWVLEGDRWRCTHRGPAMIAAAQNIDGQIVAVQRTWLKRDGHGKANLAVSRKTVGTPRGAAVRLGMVRPRLLVAEGLETGLSLFQGLCDANRAVVWCVLGTAGMRSVEVPETGVKEVFFAIDGDAPSLKAAKVGAARLCKDYDTRVMRSPRGMDWNDVLQQFNTEHKGSAHV